MIKILFVCHGNICRSPTAEFLMRHLVVESGHGADFEISSAATSSEELGNPIYPPAKTLLQEFGIDCTGKVAVQMCAADYLTYDLLIGMDHANLCNMKRIVGGDPAQKLHLLLHFAGCESEIADPWYTRDFETSFQQIHAGCKALLRHCIEVYL